MCTSSFNISKCAFCEKPLEGRIEQDVEHFRPKCEVRPWDIPQDLADAGIAVSQPANGRRTSDWAAPHFLVHLKWEFVERSYMLLLIYMITQWPVLLSSQDELNSLGVA